MIGFTVETLDGPTVKVLNQHLSSSGACVFKMVLVAAWANQGAGIVDHNQSRIMVKNIDQFISEKSSTLKKNLLIRLASDRKSPGSIAMLSKGIRKTKIKFDLWYMHRSHSFEAYFVTCDFLFGKISTILLREG